MLCGKLVPAIPNPVYRENYFKSVEAHNNDWSNLAVAIERNNYPTNSFCI
jgi:hypothetical protein